MRVDIVDSDSDSDSEGARRRLAYRRERDMVANATAEHLVGLLGADDELQRTAARDELVRRNQLVST